MLGYRILIAFVLALGAAAVSIGTAAAYTVKPGDSLWGISSRTGVPVSKIAADNHLANPGRIYVGEHLAIQSGAPGAAAVAASGQPARTYVVKRGDSLWRIARQTATSIPQIVSLNNISANAILHVGQTLLLTSATAPQAAPGPAAAVRGQAAKQLLVAAAHEFNMKPAFILAVSLWESGYNQGVVSSTGAIGLMQIEPATAAWAGPALLGGPVDINEARSNARLGTALLAHYLQVFNNDPKLTLAAYYQGAAATQAKGILPESRRYVDGVWALRNQLAGSG